MSNVLEELGLAEDSSTQEGIVDETEEQGEVKPKSRAKKFWTIAGFTGISVLAAGALLVLIGSLTVPEKTEEIVMGTVTKAKDVVHKAVPATEPIIRLGIDGGQAELDWCDGTWINQTSYVDVLGKPSYSAHNGCGGDIILNKGIGDTLKIQDQSGVISTYKVVDTFSHPQATTKISDLNTGTGEMLLQTCNWDSVTLKFVMLDKVATT